MKRLAHWQGFSSSQWHHGLHDGNSNSNIKAAAMRKMKVTTTTRVGKLSRSMNARKLCIHA
jgi:hypothetical protein